MPYYSNQANRLIGLVKNLENKYNKNEILYNNAVKLVSDYHSEINQLASNAKVKHANKKLAKLNLAVVKQNGSVDFPVRVWNKYLNAAEQAVQNAINTPTSQNITVAQNEINNVTNNQNKIERILNNGPKNIVPVPNTPKNNNRPNGPNNEPNTRRNNRPANLPGGCDRFGFSALTNRSAIRKAFRNIARSNHSNKGGMGKINMNELVRCRDAAIAKLPPNMPKNIVPVPNKPPNKPKINTTSLESRIISKNGVSKVKTQLPAAPKPPNRKVMAPTTRPAPGKAMSLANQLKAKKNSLKKTGNMAANRFRKNVPRASNKFRGLVSKVNTQLPAAPKPPNRKVMAPAPRPAPGQAMSLANQLKAKKRNLKPVGARAAPQFRRNVPQRGAARFRGAVRGVQAARRFR